MEQNDIAARAHAMATRPLHKFDVPAGVAKTVGVKMVALVELTAGEEAQAYTRGTGSAAKTSAELAKTSLRFLDGRTLSISDGSVDLAWETAHPKLRQLIIAAYGELHSPDRDDVQGFLGSRRVELG